MEHHHPHHKGLRIPNNLPAYGQSGQSNWAGVNSYFLYALPVEKQEQLLSDLALRGFKMLRIFVAGVKEHFKQTAARSVPHYEEKHMGVYDATVLELIDDLMVRSLRFGVKLAIALHDRYALGCWSCDGYQVDLELRCLPAENLKCSAANNATAFYTNATAVKYFDQRLASILNHTNPKLGNVRWGDLKDVVAIFEVQNDAQGLDDQPWVQQWHCKRAEKMKDLVDPQILIGTGGGRTFGESWLFEHFNCSHLDVVNLHDYSWGSWGDLSNSLGHARKLALQYNKLVMYEEFGTKDRYKRPDLHYSVLSASVSNGIPFMSWEDIWPGNYDNGDYEWDHTQATWPVMVYGVLLANETQSVLPWPNLELPDLS